MKKLVIIITLLIFGLNAKASHIVGANMSYDCLGNNTYKIKVTVFHECGFPVPLNGISLFYESSCTAGCQEITGITSLGQSPVSYGCGADCSEGSPYQGYLKTEFEKIITLPSECADWKVWATLIARSSSATVTYASGTGNCQNYVLINNTNGICNNSPVFDDQNIFFSCTNSLSTFQNTYTEIDGDLLVFSLTTPLKGDLCTPEDIVYPTGNIPGGNILSPTNPFPSTNSGFTFDSSNGNVGFTPIIGGTSFFAIKCQEYRNGVLISETLRDGLVIAYNCPTNLNNANLGNWIGEANNSIEIDRWQADCFAIPINSENPMGEIIIPNLPNNFSYHVSGDANTAVLFVCPDYAAINNSCEDITYNFSVQVNSNPTCAIAGSTNENYSLTIKGNTSCNEFAYFTNIDENDPNNTNIIPVYTKVSKKIWVGDDMPFPGYSEPIDGPTGDVIWTNDFQMEAGEEIILPACITGSNCITLSSTFNAEQDLKIIPNNCNAECESIPLEIKLKEIFECDNERVEPIIIGGEGPFTFIWSANGITSNDSIFNLHDIVSNSHVPVNYTVDIYDALGNHFSGGGQVLGTNDFYEPLSENGVIFFDYPPNSGIFTTGWYYSGQPGVDHSAPLFIADSINTSAPWYGATSIELTVWDRSGGGGEDALFNDVVYNEVWSLEGGEDWSIDNHEVNWNGHPNNDLNQPCVGMAWYIVDYRVEAKNCLLNDHFTGLICDYTDDGIDNPTINDTPILNEREDCPPTGHHIETSGAIMITCYQDGDTWYDNFISEAHTQSSSSSDTSNFRPFHSTLNLSPESEDYKIDIYPNPTTAIFHIEGDLTNITELIIYSTNGEIVYSTTSINGVISMANYENGVYLIKLIADNKIIFRRIIKQ